MQDFKIISLRKQPEKLDIFCNYFRKHRKNTECYRNLMQFSLESASPLPQWYLLCRHEEICGCCGLIACDFEGRRDLSPWLYALYVEEKYRSAGLGGKLIEYTANDARENGFQNLYCCTNLDGYWEKYNFSRILTGYYPWGEDFYIYCRSLL